MLLLVIALIPVTMILNIWYYEYRVIKKTEKDVDLISGYTELSRRQRGRNI
jgi:hypothetical protein